MSSTNVAGLRGRRAEGEPDDPLLVVRDLRTHFALPTGTVKAVDGVDLTLERGAVLGVVGESGSGKTVLSRSIMRLKLPSTARSEGSVLYEGRELVGLSQAEARHLWGREIAMVFQDPMTALNPVMKIGRQLTEHLRHHLHLERSEACATAIELLRSVRIPEPEQRMSSYPHLLSGGMRQRVCIAMAIACGAKLLLADEPTTALDVTVQNQILNLLEQQRRERSMSMVLVTHDLGVVAGRTDETAVMYAGRIVERAPTRKLFSSVRHPYTEALLQSIPRLGAPRQDRLSAIPGHPPNLASLPDGCAFHPRCPYAQERCRRERPPLEPIGPGASDHRVACWFPLGDSSAPTGRRRHGNEGPAPTEPALAGRTSTSSSPAGSAQPDGRQR